MTSTTEQPTVTQESQPLPLPSPESDKAEFLSIRRAAHRLTWEMDRYAQKKGWVKS